MARGHVLTHAGPIYRYSINLSFCLREPLCCSAICVLPDRSVNWTPPPACIAPGWGFNNSAALPIMKDSAGLCSARPTRAGIWNSPTVATIPSLPRQEMKICWCCITHSRRNGKHSAPPWTPPGFCGLRRLTLTGEVNGVTFVDRDGYRTVLQNRAWGEVRSASHQEENQ